jgi:hypothetical protein
MGSSDENVGALRTWQLGDGGAAAGDAEERPGHRSRIEEVPRGESFPEGRGGAPGVVVGHGGADVVEDVGGADAVVEGVEQRAVRAVHRLEGAFHPAVLPLVEVRHVHVCAADVESGGDEGAHETPVQPPTSRVSTEAHLFAVAGMLP